MRYRVNYERKRNPLVRLAKFGPLHPGGHLGFRNLTMHFVRRQEIRSGIGFDRRHVAVARPKLRRSPLSRLEWIPSRIHA